MRSIVLLLALLGSSCKKKSEEPPARSVTVDAAVRVAPDARNQITSPLPEAGPHPDYPTPVAAGTDKIFLLEDPDRGAKVAVTYELPPRGSLVWTSHTHCEPDVADIACSTGGGGFASWRVARGKEVIVASAVRGTRAHETYVYVRKPDGTPMRRVELDVTGRVVEMLTFTAANRYSARTPTGANGLAGCGFIAIERDKQGRTAKRSCLQWLGEPMRDTNGVAAARHVHDARGFLTETHHEGLDGKPIANTGGITSLRFELDANGRRVVTRYRDAAGQPVAATSGCHGLRLAYDTRGLPESTTCLDAADRPKLGSTGVATYRHRNDARGCKVATRHLGADGKPVIDRTNTHGFDLEVDAQCHETARTCINIVEQPLACGVGRPARTVDKLDAHGRVLSRKHYTADGKPGGDPTYQVFELRSQYDAAGNEIGGSCYDAAGKAIECARTGLHATKRMFDDAGRVIEERFFDPAGAPTTNIGTAIRRFRYDNYDHLYEATSHDVDGNLEESLGMTTRRDLYDTAHRHFAILLLDRAGKPARYTGCYTGVTCPKQPWHAVRLVRGPDGAVNQNQFFDAAGQLLQTVDCRVTSCFD
jgi:hypothetical protein